MTIRILRAEDVRLTRPMVLRRDREEAEQNYDRAIAATENLKQFVEQREREMFPENEKASAAHAGRIR